MSTLRQSARDTAPPADAGRRITSPAGIALIQRFEGWSAKIYTCPAGLPTIGWGHVVKPGERIDPPITRERGLSLMLDDLAPTERALGEMFPWLPQGQFDACVSLIYNIGLGAFRKSTLARLLAARDMAGAADQFPRWNKSAGKVLPGLVTRRAAERALFLGEN